MNQQHELEELLRKKGIGPEGSKSLKEDELLRLDSLLLDNQVSITTKATILTAFLLLEPTEAEKKWIYKTKSNYHNLPKELHFFFRESSHPYSGIIHKILRSESLTEREAEKGMELLFDASIEDCYKAAFLEGERLKRESFEENKAFFSFLYSKAKRIELNIPLIIDICDNYDGSGRTRNFSLFTAALLGAAGFPTVVHGVDIVAPKFGYTPHKILKAAGKDPLISPEKAVQKLTSPNICWTYIDQQVYFPELYQLKKIRKEMVKRPFLATFEKLLQPLRSSAGNHIVTGFTHSHYKSEIAKQLKEQGYCKQAIVLKGSEGSSHMSLSKETICILYDGREITESTLNPSMFGLQSLEVRQDKNINENQSLQEGMEALKGVKNYARENILYLACSILSKFKLLKGEEAVKILSKTLDSGKALKAWEEY
jgi:anthranilate phosphoribosyltransferase